MIIKLYEHYLLVFSTSALPVGTNRTKHHTLVINELSKLSNKFCLKLESKSRVELTLADGLGIAGALENIVFILYIRVVQTVGPGPKFGPLTDFFLGPLGLKYMH